MNDQMGKSAPEKFADPHSFMVVVKPQNHFKVVKITFNKKTAT